MSRRIRRRPWLVSVIGPRHLFFSQTRVTRTTPISRPGYPSVSRGWPPPTAANTHLRPLLAGLPEFLLAATRNVRLAGHARGRGSVRSPALSAPASPGTRPPGFRRSAPRSPFRRTTRSTSLRREPPDRPARRGPGGRRGQSRFRPPALSLEGNARRLEEGSPLQLAGFEEPENRQHSPVFGCALRQVELGKDAADVFLDRALGDEDPLGDARVGPALGHEGEHVALTWRQDIEWITPPASLDEFLHQGWIYHRGACGDPLDRLDELRYVGHQALQQVAEVLPAGQQLHRLVHFHVRGQHDDRRAGQLIADHPRRPQTLGLLPRRHPDVDDRQVGAGRPDQG